MAQYTDCLYTTVKNVSGATRFFGFLPPHGRELVDDEEHSVAGDIFDAIARGERGTAQRHIDALLKAIEDGDMVIVKSASPIILDEVLDSSHVLQLASGELGIDEPCFESEISA